MAGSLYSNPTDESLSKGTDQYPLSIPQSRDKGIRGPAYEPPNSLLPQFLRIDRLCDDHRLCCHHQQVVRVGLRLTLTVTVTVNGDGDRIQSTWLERIPLPLWPLNNRSR